MFSYPRKSAQRYGLFFTLTTLYEFLRSLLISMNLHRFMHTIYYIWLWGGLKNTLICPKNEKGAKKFKKIAKRFGSLKIVRTFAIPKQSGGGEMVDTLL